MGERQFPEVDVAVAVLVRDGRVLAVYNDRWGGFTLPMTKRREPPQDPNVQAAPAPKQAVWLSDAVRAQAEWLGRTCVLAPKEYLAPKFLLDIPDYQQSDRDGCWKRYTFQVFGTLLPHDVEPVPGKVREWLSPDDFVDRNRVPITNTARHIMAKLRLVDAFEAMLSAKA